MKAASGKQLITQGFSWFWSPVRLSADVSSATLEARKQYVDRLKVLKEKPCQPRIILSKLSFRHEGGIKTFPDKQKWRRFVTRSVLQETLKGGLQGGRTLDSSSKPEEREISVKVNTWTTIKAHII